MVLLSQFRKDIKSSFRVEKTMAHRKQIKVSKQSETENTNTRKASSKKTTSKCKRSQTKQSEIVLEELGPSHEPQPGPSHEPQPGLSHEPQPGPSHAPQPGSSHDQQLHADEDDTSDLCQKCFREKEAEWIQCDACNSWFHRTCAGLKTARLWKKYMKENVSWFCYACK